MHLICAPFRAGEIFFGWPISFCNSLFLLFFLAEIVFSRHKKKQPPGLFLVRGTGFEPVTPAV